MSLPLGLRFPLDYNNWINLRLCDTEGWFNFDENNVPHYNQGNAFQCAEGTPVHAMQDSFGFNYIVSTEFFGNIVSIRHKLHPEGEYVFRSWYGRLGKVCVDTNTVIKKGDIIGYSAGSGKNPATDGIYYPAEHCRTPHLLWGFSRAYPTSIPEFPHLYITCIPALDVPIKLPTFHPMDKDGNEIPFIEEQKDPAPDNKSK